MYTLIKKIINKIFSHLSFLFIVFGSGSFFLANIIFRSILTEKDYGLYSILVTYFSITYVFGLLGLEQIFLRYSRKVNLNIISTQKIQLQSITIVALITSFLSSFLFEAYIKDKFILNPILLYISSFCIVALLIVFNIFRLNSNFVFAQFISNFWRIILMFLAFLMLYFKISDFTVLANFLMVSISAIFIFSIIYLSKKIRFIYEDTISKKNFLIVGTHFFLSILIFCALAFGDRIIIERKFGINNFGYYFYLTNFFLAPFTILQNYIGFKQLIYFKNEFSFENFKKNNHKTFLFGCSVGLMLYLLIYVLNYIRIIKINFYEYQTLIILLIILGIVRLYFSSINAAFEARTSINSLRKANLRFLLIAVFMTVLMLCFFDSLNLIVFGFIIIWILRSIIIKDILLRQMLVELKNNKGEL